MNELFLHYIWQFQYFDKKDLRCSSGEAVTVLHPGFRNTHAGPDFHDAKLKLDSIEWAGSVEIHLQASHWREHRHQEDAAYDNVVLHVVWEEDEKIHRNDGTNIPTVELRDRVSSSVLLQYKRIMHSKTRIPCANAIQSVPEVIRFSMLDRALMARLEAKAAAVLAALGKNNGDWEETCYQIIARNFGFKVNTDPFQQLAGALPYRILMKHADRPGQIEALLFGQAGFLGEPVNDAYYQLLSREYRLLSQKYRLAGKRMNRAQWRFLRLRPANFPTLRLAQFAAVLHHQKNLFSRILGATSWRALSPIFAVQPSDYWKSHYRFFKRQKNEIGPMGTASIENIAINSIVPMLVAYGRSRDDQRLVDRAIDLLHDIPAEKNNILQSWALLGVHSRSAFDSQALIELHNSFCLRRRCLDCKIGFRLLQPAAYTPQEPVAS